MQAQRAYKSHRHLEIYANPSQLKRHRTSLLCGEALQVIGGSDTQSTIKSLHLRYLNEIIKEQIIFHFDVLIETLNCTTNIEDGKCFSA